MADSAVPSVSDLQDERVTVLNQIDDILNTAAGESRPLTDIERSEHDVLVARHDELGETIARANGELGDIARAEAQAARKTFDVPNISRSVNPARAGRSLDELLWATAPQVAAGSLSRSGDIISNGSTAPVEQVIVRSEDNKAVMAPRLSEFRPDDHNLIRSFQQTVADMATFGLMIDDKAKSSRDGFEVARSHRLYADRWNRICRAMDVDTSAEGTDWVPTGIGSSLHEKVRATGKIAPLFQTINLPSNPWKMPIEGADATAYRVGEPTGDTESKPTASTPGTVVATFDAEIFGGRVLFSRSLEADSAVAILPYVQRKLVQAFVDAEEKAILDGDTDGTHQDTDVHALGATDARWAWDGLRKKGIAQTVVTATTASVANLLAIRAGMGKWGVNPADLVYIVGVSNYHDLLADSSLLTVDKLGPQATILNGQVGSVGGVPVVVSEHVREDLNATGVDDNITATKTYLLCVNRNEWVMGQRMALDLQVDDSIYRETYQRVAVAFMREDFQHVGSAATNDDTAIAYNVTP